MGIYVWGTGCGASELLEQGFALERVEAFVDSFPMGENFLNKPVILPEQMDISACDLLIITARHAEAIAQRCIQLEIPAEKCLFLKNNTTLLDRNESCSAAKEILGADLLKKLIPNLGENCTILSPFFADYGCYCSCCEGNALYIASNAYSFISDKSYVEPYVYKTVNAISAYVDIALGLKDETPPVIQLWEE